jgi:hypothetical protein
VGTLPTLSVVIASIGRPSLTRILHDISATSVDFSVRVILVLDGVDPLHPNLSQWERMSSKLVVLPERVGSARAYSLGLREVNTEFFRIFSDDDEWDGNSLRVVYRNVRENSVLVCRTNVRDELGFANRSAEFPKYESPLESVYAPLIPWHRNDVYFHLTSMIFPFSASRISFDDSLIIREDLDWLQRVYESGMKFIFLNETIGTVFPSHARSAERQTIEIDTAWATRLTLISNTVAKNFVYFHCFRSFAVFGKPSEILRRIIPLYKIVGKPDFRQTRSLLLYLIIGIFMKTKIKLKR